METSSVKDNFVLDSSVIIKWFCDEEDTEKALQMRKNFQEGKVAITTPDLMIYELANALRYNKKLSKVDIQNAINSIMSMGLSIIVPTKKVLESAISLAIDNDITLYDSYFIALAKELGFTFVTADRKLYNKTKDLKFTKILHDLKFDYKQQASGGAQMPAD